VDWHAFATGLAPWLTVPTLMALQWAWANRTTYELVRPEWTMRRYRFLVRGVWYDGYAVERELVERGRDLEEAWTRLLLNLPSMPAGLVTRTSWPQN
jgi:hypothetical protein